ncbi:MAG: SDR family oxidoreductase [Candidatus Promineifilaceae bacterium]
MPNRAAYSISKAAVIGLTKSIAADYTTKGIRVNAIAPGTVDSPSLHERWHATGDFEAAKKAFIARQPIGRIAEPEEVADLARLPRRRDLYDRPGARHRRRLDSVSATLTIGFPPPCGEGSAARSASDLAKPGWGATRAPSLRLPPSLIPPRKGKGDDCRTAS